MGRLPRRERREPSPFGGQLIAPPRDLRAQGAREDLLGGSGSPLQGRPGSANRTAPCWAVHETGHNIHLARPVRPLLYRMPCGTFEAIAGIDAAVNGVRR